MFLTFARTQQLLLTPSSIWQGEGERVPEYFTTLQVKHNLDYFDRHAKPLTPLSVGDDVLVQSDAAVGNLP